MYSESIYTDADDRLTNLIALVVAELVRPDCDQQVAVWNGRRAEIALALECGVRRDAIISPWSRDRLLLAFSCLQVESVLGLSHVQDEDVKGLIVRAERVLLNDSLALIDGIVGVTGRECTIVDRVIAKQATFPLGW